MSNAPFTKEMRKTHTILIPNMLPIHWDLLVRIFDNFGYKVEILKNQPVITFQFFQLARCFIDCLAILTVSSTFSKIRQFSVINLFEHSRTAEQR